MNASHNQKPDPGNRDDFVARLIALKRHEQPDPYFETRNLAALREKLAHTAPGRAWGQRWFGWLAGESMPAFRMVVAACLLALLAANLLFLQSAPPERPTAAEPAPVVAAESTAPTSEVLQVASTNESLDLYRKPVFVFEYPSNRHPVGPVQMGPRSVPVRYDF